MWNLSGPLTSFQRLLQLKVLPRQLQWLLSRALGIMKQGKATGPLGVISEMLKTASEGGLQKLRLLAELVFSSGEIPKDLEESFILNLYKGKGEALDRGNYRGLKLTDQVMNLLGRVLDIFIRKMVNIDNMQFLFVPGRGTTDSILSSVSLRGNTSTVVFSVLMSAFGGSTWPQTNHFILPLST